MKVKDTNGHAQHSHVDIKDTDFPLPSLYFSLIVDSNRQKQNIEKEEGENFLSFR